MENKEIIEAIEKDTVYDFIADNYCNMSKFDLRCILLEYIYALYEIEKHGTGLYQAVENIIENLKSMWDIE